MNILRLGDPHGKMGSLEELKGLINFVVEMAILYKVDRIEVLGDLFHTHNVIRLEIIEFWVWALDLLSKTCETVVLVGNHDLSGDHNSRFSALSVFGLMNKPNLYIIEKPIQMGVFGYVPYTHNSDTFIANAKVLADEGVTVLVCHQTIEGSQYESGIWAPDGIPTANWAEKFTHIISGHIHSEQSFGNIIYPGTARWDTVVDANKRKGIWIYEHSANGRILASNYLGTEKVCSPIRHIEYREGDAFPTWGDKDRIAVELIGTSAWIAGEKEKLKGKCSLKTTPTDKKQGTIRQTGGSFENFVKDLFSTKIDKQELLKYAKEIGIV